MTQNPRDYKKMEPTLGNIFGKFISLREDQEKQNKQIVKELLEKIIPELNKDSLFNALFNRVFYGGSFYDGLRIKSPDEFDLDLLLNLPKLTKPEIQCSNKPGYVKLRLAGINDFVQQKDQYKNYLGLDKLLDKKNFLDHKAVLRWMEGVVTKALQAFKLHNGRHVITVPSGSLYVKVSKSGPAFTLKIDFNHQNLDIDLVPCFSFKDELWPKGKFRKNPCPQKPEFFIVPKPLKDFGPDTERYWRLSFQEQERELINSKNYLKPSIKLLKKIRDKFDHKMISSYFLKTVVLWLNLKNPSVFTNNMSFAFMTALKTYYEFLQEGRIPYFWDERYNLLEKNSEDTLFNVKNCIKRLINNLETKMDNPLIIAEQILTKKELEDFKRNPTPSEAESTSCLLM